MNNQNNKSGAAKDSEDIGNDKIHKLLASAGLGSRREMERWIIAGRIKINKKLAQIGDRVSSTDRVTVDDKPLANKGVFLSRSRVILYNKPVGIICTKKDPKGRKTVYDAIPSINKAGRWISVGRLDINTSGLLLFTTDGELANRLMHPSYEITREYAVRVFGEVSDENFEKIKAGVEIDGKLAKFESVTSQGGEAQNHWYNCTIKEGRNREVRKIWETLTVRVSRLIRISYANVTLPKGLSIGKAEELTPDEVNQLRALVGLHKFVYPEKMKSVKRRRV
ncbi:MAG: 23S rRNA pseudouridine2605 synthase [Francisellaceae bacterium]|jgi:23S rRNA pseudouridine2605 synthase